VKDKKRHIFVSGCYDIIHAGHLQFFSEAKALGDFLTVCFASEEVLWNHKQRRSSLPDEHKKAIIGALNMVDEVVIGKNPEHGLDFQDDFLKIRPDVLAVTEDDKYADKKKKLCEKVGATYIVLPKTPPQYEQVSTTQLVKWIKAPTQSPLRVDLAGGWLDVPKYSREGAYIVNCAISPLVSLKEWGYNKNAGLGGSGAWSLLNGNTGVEDEINLGVGWQDPAVIKETGLCVWRSGHIPSLEFKTDGTILKDKIAIWWSGCSHDTPSIASKLRDYDLIEEAGKTARKGVLNQSLELLGKGISLSYQAQIKEGMQPLPNCGEVSKKYCGGGFGGYALYLFHNREERDQIVEKDSNFKIVQPFCNWDS
jgi:cytidyltransferase-like protein